LLEAAQRLLAVLVEGVVAAGTQAVTAMAGPMLHPALPALTLALPTLRRPLDRLMRLLAPLINVSDSSTSHSSAPQHVSQDCQPHGPEDDEAEHHQGDPCRPAE